MKHVFTICIDALPVNTTIVAHPRKTLMQQVRIQSTESLLSLDCKRVEADGVDAVCFETFSDTFAETVQNRLHKLNVNYSYIKHPGAFIRVNVLSLLDTHWMLFQLIDESKLKIKAIDGIEHYLDFHNDGENMWATFDGTQHNLEDGADLIDSLIDMGTKYEVTV